MREKDLPDITLFCDDSGSGNDRYRAVAAVSVPTGMVDELRDVLRNTWESQGVKCLKWSKTGIDVKNRKLVASLYKLLRERMQATGVPRITTLIWDMRDSRHDVPGRSDPLSHAFMYYKLIRYVAEIHEGPRVAIIADSGSNFSWPKIEEVLNHTPPSRHERYRKYETLSPWVLTIAILLVK